MGLQFDWQVDENEGNEEIRPNRNTPPWFVWGLSALLAIILLSLVGSIWWRVRAAENDLRQSAQHVLDLEQQAFLAQDGELFFSVFNSADTTFQSAQLRPDQQRHYRGHQTVTKAEKHNNIIWANVSTEVDGERYQRIAFFEQLSDGTRHIPTDSAYWGEEIDTSLDWGSLTIFSADNQWLEQFDAAISSTLDTAPLATGQNRIFIVVIRDDFAISPLPQIVYYPSPRLVGLNDKGEPNAAYWTGLQAAIAAQITPVTLQFALPDYLETDGLAISMRQAASDFAAQFPPGRIEIEFLTKEVLSDKPTDWLTTVDGAMLQPTEALIKEGAIYDLTQLVALDREFDQGDFYPQTWQAAWWNDRMWFVPWSNSLNLVYINADLFKNNQLLRPSAEMHWQDLESLLTQIEVPDGDGHVLIDPSRDLLYAYAFSHAETCRDADCLAPLTATTAADALAWHRQLVDQLEIAPNLAAVDAIDREFIVLGTLSAHKQVALWVGSSIDYEYQLGLQSTIALPFFDFSAENPLKMPLHVHGHIISSYTDQPYWTWQWVKYLSYQAPISRMRHIPARPSITRQSGFWRWLPSPIASAYKKMLPTARPLLIGDENYFTWPQLALAVESDQITPQIARPVQTDWFMPQR